MSRGAEAGVNLDAGFAADQDGARWAYIGPLTFANAGPVLAATAAVALPTGGEVDFQNAGAIDSSAVAVLLALKRRAEGEGAPLRFLRVPAPLVALAEVYGVESILGT